jgi:hypothetical protein
MVSLRFLFFRAQLAARGLGILTTKAPDFRLEPIAFRLAVNLPRMPGSQAGSPIRGRDRSVYARDPLDEKNPPLNATGEFHFAHGITPSGESSQDTGAFSVTNPLDAIRTDLYTVILQAQAQDRRFS